MKAMAAREAKNQFGRLMDAVQREPVTIEKHGRAVAVMMSVEEYKQIKLGRLQSEVRTGLVQLETDESTVFAQADLKALLQDIKARGRARRNVA